MDIQSRCVVVVLSVKLPGQYRKDRRKTAEVCAEAGAAETAGRWSNSVWPAEAITPCREQYTATRELLYSRSVPWLADGQRLILVGELLTLRPQLDKMLGQFNQLADEAAAQYDTWVSMARRERNGLFSERDYKGPHHFRSRFALTVQYLPVPDESHIVCQLADDDLRVLREGVSIQVADAMETGRRDVLDRIAAPLRNMVSRLSDPDAIFRDSLVTNIRELADALPALNLAGDATLTDIHPDLTQLGAQDPQVLRDNKIHRRSVADLASAILAKVDNA